MKMTKSSIIAISALFSIALPALAETYGDKAEDTRSDVHAIYKDDAAISHQKKHLRHNRAAKAADKARGDYGDQAVDSVKIGANKAALAEKRTEKDTDRQILTHDEQK
ncbi:MAG: hypothetical protein M3N08_03850 [Pseudomonadota bacterium]|nr:hypothetical protein [Pseudomonadota bacterium]